MSYDTAQPYLACFVLLKKDNKIAAVMRENSSWMNGYYSVPSGKVEKGERLQLAAVREALEEVGVKINEADLRYLHTCHRKAQDDTDSWIDVYFEAIKWEGEPYNAEPTTHSELAWLDLGNLPGNIIPSQRFEINQILSGSPYSEYEWPND